MRRAFRSFLWPGAKIGAMAVVLLTTMELVFPSYPDPAVNDEHRAGLLAEQRGDWFSSIAYYESALDHAAGNPNILQRLFTLHARLGHRLSAGLYECALSEAANRPAEAVGKLAATSRALLRTADALYGEALDLARVAGDPGGNRQSRIIRLRAAMPSVDWSDSLASAAPCLGIVAEWRSCAAASSRACTSIDFGDPALIDPELITRSLRTLGPQEASDGFARLAAKQVAAARLLKARATNS